MKRYALYDAGTGRFCRDEDDASGNIFTFEATDFDEADYLNWSIVDRLIDNGSLSNDGTQLVQLGSNVPDIVDDGFCMRARDAQNDGEEWE